MSIHVGTQLYTHIAPGSDRDSFEALANARALKETGHSFSSAVLHRFDGLLLIEGSPHDKAATGHHLRCANCGFDGTGPQTAAEILEMFGFGSKDELLAQLARTNSLTLTRS